MACGRKFVITVPRCNSSSSVGSVGTPGLLLDLKVGEKIEVSRRQAVKFKEMMSL